MLPLDILFIIFNYCDLETLDICRSISNDTKEIIDSIVSIIPFSSKFSVGKYTFVQVGRDLWKVTPYDKDDLRNKLYAKISNKFYKADFSFESEYLLLPKFKYYIIVLQD